MLYACLIKVFALRKLGLSARVFDGTASREETKAVFTAMLDPGSGLKLLYCSKITLIFSIPHAVSLTTTYYGICCVVLQRPKKLWPASAFSRSYRRVPLDVFFALIHRFVSESIALNLGIHSVPVSPARF